MLERLLNSLNSLCEFLEEVYEINEGGCCFVAMELAKQFDKLHIKYELVVYDTEERSQFEIEDEIRNKHRNSMHRRHCITGTGTCYHYCLKVGDTFINDTDREVYGYLIPDVDASNISYIYKNGLWNDLYNKNHNKTVRSLIKSFFKEYEDIDFKNVCLD